jgi:hypothetical protein
VNQTQPPSDEPALGAAPEHDETLDRLPTLPIAMRLILMVVGWVLFLVGVAGLALPGIQGCLTLAVAAAVLSLTSEMIYRWLRKLLHRRSPGAWDRVERFRGWLHRKLSRDSSPDDDPSG